MSRGSGYATLWCDGCELSYRLVGTGPPVVLIQGVGVHGDGWYPQTRQLGRRFTCLTFDNRGMGKSQPPAAEITVERMAADAWALMDSLDWQSAHVVGHSLGGVVAQQMALERPDRVRSLSLLCTVARGRDATRLSWRMLWLGLASSIGTRRSRRRAFLRLVLPPSALGSLDEDALAAELAGLFGHDLAERQPIAMKQLRALRAYDSTAALGRLADLPTVVVSAAHDLIARPEFGRALAAGIPGADFILLPEAAHGVTIHGAETVNAILERHLSAAEARRPGTPPTPFEPLRG